VLRKVPVHVGKGGMKVNLPVLSLEVMVKMTRNGNQDTVLPGKKGNKTWNGSIQNVGHRLRTGGLGARRFHGLGIAGKKK